MSAMLDKLREQRGTVAAELTELRAKTDPTDEDATRAEALAEDLEKRDEAIAKHEAAEKREAAIVDARKAVGDEQKVEHVKPATTDEARTYRADMDQKGNENGGYGFISDLYRANFSQDFRAQERLQRHAREAEVNGEGEKRAVTTGGFAGLVVPQYLTYLAALAARNGRPVANAVTRLPLPDQGMSLIIPRGTTGASEASQATENTAVSSTDEVWANLTVPVVTIAGQQDISRQAVERGIPGLDALVYRDLAGAYAAELDRQVINGSGASNQMLGIINTAGIFTATAFVAAATATTFFLKLAGAINSVEAAGTVVAPANLIVMHPRRFSWLLGQVDSQGRPLVTPVANGIQVFNGMGVDQNPGAYSGNPQAATTGVDFAGFTVKGYIQGLPVVTDANVPTAVGTGPEDQVLVVNTAHQLLWESGDGTPQQLRFEQTLGNQLTVKLVAYGYAAFTAGRYPLAASLIGGNAGAGFGLIAPTF